jgi:hypothetical protein
MTRESVFNNNFSLTYFKITFTVRKKLYLV